MTFDKYTVRLIQPDEGEKFFRLVDKNRNRLEDFFSGTVSRTATLADAEAYVAEITEKARNRTYFPFVVVDSADDSFAGFVDVKNIDWRIAKGELGCFFDEQHTGKGLAERSMRCVIEWLQKDNGFNKIFLRTHEANITARKLAEKCGFVVEGVLRKDHKIKSGDLVDLVYYGLIKA